LILGCLHIFIGFGILFNYLTYFLVWNLEPLLDKLVYNFLDFSGFNPFNMKGIMEISMFQFSHEKTIYYCIAFGSLIPITDIILSLWYLINNNLITNNPRATMYFLLTGIIGGIFFVLRLFFRFFFKL
jgi:hypothetical protein